MERHVVTTNPFLPFSLIPFQLFESEAKRKIKKDPAVAMDLKNHMFLTPDQKEQIPEEAISVQGDVVTELWTF
jgi:hypothetical protein